MTASTPGPWHVECPYGEPGVYVASKSTALVAKLYDVDANDARKGVTIDANAALIASAPTMAARISALESERAELRGALEAAEVVLGENLQWIADQADLGVRQKDPETLRRLAQLRNGWERLVRAMRARRALGVQHGS